MYMNLYNDSKIEIEDGVSFEADSENPKTFASNRAENNLMNNFWISDLH